MTDSTRSDAIETSARVGPLGAGTRPHESARIGPTAIDRRLGSLDLLRGVGVLGILVLNAFIFAMPFAALSDPTAHGGSRIVDLAAWAFTHVFCDQKFFPIFTMLFGAGIVLMADKAERAGRPLGWYFVRRHFWLLVIGAAHAYLLWWGDILLPYALCAFMLYLFRRRSARTLLIVGVLVYAVGLAGSTVVGLSFEGLRAEAQRIEAARAAGESIAQEEEQAAAQWAAVRSLIAPSEAEMAAQIERFREGGYREIVSTKAPVLLQSQTLGFVTYSLWRIAGMMLVGMGLMKLGLLAGSRSERFFRRLAAAGFALGLPLALLSVWALASHGFDAVYLSKVGIYFNYIGGPILSLGYIGVILLAWKRGWMKQLQDRLRAVGRMALTNYLMQSVLMTLLFYGYGFGLYGSVRRAPLLGIVLIAWVLQIAWSAWWLRRFEFGPAEWLWRTLTYVRVQPFVRRSGHAERAA